MRIVGLDHGTRRIGVAVADTETGMAFARTAIQRRNLDRDLVLIGELCADEGAGLIVIGLPRNMDGSEGAQAAAARRFGDQLGRIGLEVAYEDERLTSWEARERLAEQGRRPSRRGGELDSTAARLILQQYLDAQSMTPSHDPAHPEETE
jgi:putative Holliday junction resolvase